MIAILASMFRDEEAAAMVEYGLLIALIAIVALTAVTLIGSNLSTIFNTVAITL